MIVVDRALTDAEAERLAAGPTLWDLRAAVAQGTALQDALLAWIDHAYAYPWNGQPVDEFFGWDGHSYWLHVRYRLFFALYGDAQLLDRLPDRSRLARIEEVYCDPPAAGFWSRWAPQAVRHVRATEQANAAPPRSRPGGMAGLARLLALLKNARWAAREPWEGVFFSTSAYNVRRPEGLWDRQLGPLFDQHPAAAWLRLEYEPLAIKSPAQRHDTPRLQPTLSSDALLAHYLLCHPHAALHTVNAFRTLRRRFAQPLRYAYPFPFGDAVWKAMLQRTLRQLAPSVAAFVLLRRAFRWFLERQEPRFVVATGENNSVGRLFVEAGKALGTPTFGVQHGIIAPHNVDYRFSAEEARRAFPDHFFAWGERTRAFLTSQSHYPPERVHVVGRLLSDALVDPVPDAGLMAYKKAQARPLLFFASQWQQNRKNRAEAALQLAAFCAAYGFCCAVKLHPAEADDGLYQALFAERGLQDRLRLYAGELYAALAACDYGATCFSTVAWEIMSLGKPLLVFDPLHLNLLQLRGQGAVFHVGTGSFDAWRQHLAQHVAAGKALAETMLGPWDGQVGARIAASLACLS